MPLDDAPALLEPAPAAVGRSGPVGMLVRVGLAAGMAYPTTLSLITALLFMVAGGLLSAGHRERQAAEPTVIQLKLLPPPRDLARPEPEPPAPAPVLQAMPVPAIAAPEIVVAAVPDTPRQPATMAAPPAPTAEE